MQRGTICTAAGLLVWSESLPRRIRDHATEEGLRFNGGIGVELTEMSLPLDDPGQWWLVGHESRKGMVFGAGSRSDHAAVGVAKDEQWLVVGHRTSDGQ